MKKVGQEYEVVGGGGGGVSENTRHKYTKRSTNVPSVDEQRIGKSGLHSGERDKRRRMATRHVV